jgi:Protein of unknown function (DUF3592)
MRSPSTRRFATGSFHALTFQNRGDTIQPTVRTTPTTTAREGWFLRLFFAFLSLLFLALTWMGTQDRITLLQHSERATGEVVRIYPKDGRCQRRKRSYDCTRFLAGVRVVTKSKDSLEVFVDAGSTRGHGQPTSSARYQLKEAVPVIFDPNHPEEAIRDSVYEVWALPAVMAFLLCVCVYSLLRGRFPLQT